MKKTQVIVLLSNKVENKKGQKKVIDKKSKIDKKKMSLNFSFYASLSNKMSL
jgi:hypothetical protein